MASVIDSVHEALQEDNAYVKIVGYAIPVYLVVNWFLVGKMHMVAVYGFLLTLLLIGLLGAGINNVRRNRREILTLNPITLVVAIFKSVIVLAPQLLIYGFLGHILTTKIVIPVDVQNFSLIYSIIIWAVLGSIVLTSYMSFAKYLKISQGYNYKVVAESCVDVFVSFVIVFLPQWVLANLVLVGPVAYLYHFLFRLPFTHWGFVAYCSMIFIVNVSILANYLAQSAYEHIKGNNEEYDENVQLNIIEATAERMR